MLNYRYKRYYFSLSNTMWSNEYFLTWLLSNNKSRPLRLEKPSSYFHIRRGKLVAVGTRSAAAIGGLRSVNRLFHRSI